MLTLRKISLNPHDALAAGRAADYPLERRDAPDAFRRAAYYAGGNDEVVQDRANSIWVGSPRALAAQGVRAGAEVTRDELSLALRGLHSTTGEKVRQPGAVVIEADSGMLGEDGEGIKVREPRINSVDVTLSPPKSFSAVYSQASPELKAELERIATRAAGVALDYVLKTKDVMSARDERGEKIYVPARGYVASMTVHVTARTAHTETVPSPQVHIHNVVVGLERPDATLATPQTRALFKDNAALEGGAIFRAVLAHGLTKLGFEIRAGTGRNHRFFEIDGVPEGLIEVWSARAREVEQRVRELEAATGRTLTGGALGSVAMLTRAPKATDLTPEEITRAWDATAREFGLGPERVEGIRGRRSEELTVSERTAEVRMMILQRIWERGPTVTAAEARAAAFEAAPAGALTPHQAIDLLDTMQRDGDLVTLEDARVTSSEIRSREQYVMRTVLDAASRVGEPVSERATVHGIDVVNSALGAGRELLPNQCEAVSALTDGRGWATLTGAAGTGKGRVLQAVAEAYRTDGWKVVACAVDGATAQRLAHQIGGSARTIESVLVGALHDAARIDDRTLIVIDEASKVGLAHWVELASIAESNRVRVVAVGHAGQLGAIELPGIFEAMLRHDGIPTAMLTDVMRHRDPVDLDQPHPWLGGYLELVNAGRGEEALAVLQEHGAITMHDTRELAMDALIEDWDRYRDVYQSTTDVILQVHGSNHDVDRLNELAQERRIERGELAGEGILAVDRSYRLYQGDVVMLRGSAYEPASHEERRRTPRVENGTIGIVTGIDVDHDRVHVSFDEPGDIWREVTIEFGPLRERLASGERDVSSPRLAYAVHPYVLQGETKKAVGVLDGDRTQNLEATYTADARAEQILFKHTDRESLGRKHLDCHGLLPDEHAEQERTDQHRYRLLAERMQTSQRREASIIRQEVRYRVGVELPALESIPEHPARDDVSRAIETQSPGLWRQRDSRQEEDEQLARYRRLLGPALAEQLGRDAERHRELFTGLDEADLRTYVQAGQDAVAELDLPSAMRAVALESQRLIAEERLTRAKVDAEQAREAVEDQRVWRLRAPPSELLETAQARERELEQDREALVELEAKVYEMRTNGHDPRAWAAEHGDALARSVAAERELTERRGLEPDTEWAEQGYGQHAEAEHELVDEDIELG